MFENLERFPGDAGANPAGDANLILRAAVFLSATLFTRRVRPRGASSWSTRHPRRARA